MTQRAEDRMERIVEQVLVGLMIGCLTFLLALPIAVLFALGAR